MKKMDKYYTKPDIVDLCLSYIDVDSYDNVIEPSAGDGAFSTKINCTAFDIHPNHQDIIQQDYLEYKHIMKGTTLVIGNPPFGRNNSMSLAFIKHSIFSDCIAFILPKSFKKQSLQDKVPIYFHLIKEIDIPPDSFIYNNKSYNVPCVFQIWEKQDIKRLKPKPLIPKSFSFVKSGGDVSIRRVGVNAGQLYTNTDKSPSSHYFLKVGDGFIEKYNKIKWLHNNTVGCNSISKQELIREIDYENK